MQNEKYPRRVFIKSTAATAALAMTLTTDSKLKSDDTVEPLVVGPGTSGHVYVYSD